MAIEINSWLSAFSSQPLYVSNRLYICILELSHPALLVLAGLKVRPCLFDTVDARKGASASLAEFSKSKSAGAVSPLPRRCMPHAFGTSKKKLRTES
jgi:hypothetical protein